MVERGRDSIDVRTLGLVRDVVNGKEAYSYWYIYSGHESVPSSIYKNLAVEQRRDKIPLTKEITERM